MTEEIKLGLIAPSPPPYGGIANWTENLTAFLNSEQIQYERINIAPTKRTTEGRTLFDRVVISGFAMLKQRRQLVKLIKRNQINVIHLTTSGGLALIRDIMLIKVANSRRIPVAYHIHFGRIPQIILQNGTMWKMMKKALMLADKTVVIDKCTCDSIRNMIHDIHMQYIPNSINITKMPIAKENGEKQITFLGWCVKTKGIEELLAAWNQVSVKHDWVLNIVGPYEKDYMNSISENMDLSKVRIMGELNHEKAMEVLNNSSVFVLPSYTEGFPMSILEAMVLKKAIIATKVGAIPEILSGDCGLLIEKQNIHQLSEAMEKYINDDALRREHGENAQNKAFTEFSDKVVYGQYMDTWEEIMGDIKNAESIV